MQGKRVLLSIIALLLCTPPTAFSQDEPADGTEPEDTELTTEDVADAAETDADDGVLATDDESYRDIDDEDFTPSEEIPADQSIAFPTDI